jgi:hypothetical protein
VNQTIRSGPAPQFLRSAQTRFGRFFALVGRPDSGTAPGFRSIAAHNAATSPRAETLMSSKVSMPIGSSVAESVSPGLA